MSTETNFSSEPTASVISEDTTIEINVDDVLRRRVAYDPLDDLKRLQQKAEANRSSFVDSKDQRSVLMEFDNINFDIGDRKILKNISGYAAPGQVLAIMGPSGAGKTTLMNLLAGRLSTAKDAVSTGEIRVNGKKRDYKALRNYTAFVMQQDLFFAELTVREVIRFSAKLRLPQSLSEDEIEERINDVINELALQDCQHTRVGDDISRGLSGGEKKRLNIAAEIVTNAKLIFLDEPTSGLDSFTAQQLGGTLMMLARNGRTVISTIHQPRSSLYQMFDSLLLLSNGNCVYTGPTSQCLPYFKSIGYECPVNFNPSDYLMDLISVDPRDEHLLEVSKERCDFLADSFKDYQKTQERPVPHSEVTVANESEDKFSASWASQFKSLYTRSIKKLLRDKRSNIIIMMQSIIIAIFLGIIWQGTGSLSSGTEVQAVAGAIYFILINASFRSVFGIIFIFPAEKAVVQKERSDRCYRVSAYFLSKTIAELPRTILSNFLLVLILYPVIDLRNGVGNFLLFFLLVLLTALCAEGIAFTVSAISRDAQQAGAITPLFIMLPLLFGGFFINLDLIPVWLRWISDISFLRYAFSLVMQQQFQGLDLNIVCSPEDTFCPKSGDGVLNFYELDKLSWQVNLIILLVITVFFRFLAYFLLMRTGKPKFDKTL